MTRRAPKPPAAGPTLGDLLGANAGARIKNRLLTREGRLERDRGRMKVSPTLKKHQDGV